MSSTGFEKHGADVEANSNNEKNGSGEVGSSDSIAVGYTGEDEFAEVHHVKQGLHQRHIQMIALVSLSYLQLICSSD